MTGARSSEQDVDSKDIADLRSRVRGALEASSTQQAFDALASLEPLDAIDWIAERRVDFAFDRRALGTRVADCCEAVAGRPHARESIDRAARCLEEHLSPDDLLRIARVLRDEGGVDDANRLVDTALEREPRHVGLVRDRADRVIRSGEIGAHVWLSRLGRLDRSAATALRVYRSRSKLPRPEGRELRAALLSSFTIDSVVPHLDLEMRDLGVVPEIWVAPFGTWEREVLDPQSALRRFAPEIVFLSVSIDDLAPELAGAVDAAGLGRAGERAIERLLGAARSLASWSDAPLIVHSFYSVHRDPIGNLEGRAGLSRTRWIAELNASIADALAEIPRAFVLNVGDLLARRAGGTMDNPKMRHWASMRLAENVSIEVAQAYARYTAPLVGRTRKVVVLDLDNTLWGGVVGEDGPHGIKLAATGPGSEFQEFQRYLLALTEQGVLLAINSKNNPADAWEVIRSHSDMILREEHFSCARINWQPKPENLKEIAKELDLGLDSLIFVDDNPNERERVRQFLPQVLVPELPADPALYRRTIEALPELQRLEATEEDKNRVALYREKRERENARASVATVDEYLHTLQIALEIAPADGTVLPRVHQLFHRTNQFNSTTRRYDAGDLERIVKDPCARLYTLRARDRFGDHGLVAVALARTADEADAWRIDSFLMSCRVIGYGIETALLAIISEDAIANGATRLIGEFIPTPKNTPVADLFSRHAFDPSGSDGNSQLFERCLSDGKIDRPAWLTMDVKRHEA